MRSAPLALAVAVLGAPATAHDAQLLPPAGITSPNVQSVGRAGLSPGGAPVAGDCAGASLFCADFPNQVFILNGVSYSTFAAMVAASASSGGSGCATSTSGMSCPNGATPYSFSNLCPNAFGYMLTVRISGNSSSTEWGAALGNSSTVQLLAGISASNLAAALYGGPSIMGSAGTVGKVAAYLNSSSSATVSFGGAAVQAASGTALSGALTLSLGDLINTTNSGVYSPSYLLSARVDGGTFTNAQVQQAAAQ